MPLEPLFGDFRPQIEERFVRARADAGPAVAGLLLEIEEEPRHAGRARAEFLVVDPAGPVRITWNGVASLWALCQGLARLSRRMFAGTRERQEKLSVDDDPEIERGLNCLEFARRLCTTDIPAAQATREQWPEWLPRIEIAPAADSDNAVGNNFFLGALSWIFRHEIAHIALRHGERQKAEGLSDLDCEREADERGTLWLRGNRKAGPARPLGSEPGQEELELEHRAICMGLGLIWVALFEADRGRASQTHPQVAQRIFDCFELMGLRDDSAAAEILMHAIQAWIAPDAQWAPEGGYPTALDAISDALTRLHRHMHEATR